MLLQAPADAVNIQTLGCEEQIQRLCTRPWAEAIVDALNVLGTGPDIGPPVLQPSERCVAPEKSEVPVTITQYGAL